MFESVPLFLWWYIKVGAAWATIVGLVGIAFKEKGGGQLTIGGWLVTVVAWPFFMCYAIKELIKRSGA